MNIYLVRTPQSCIDVGGNIKRGCIAQNVCLTSVGREQAGLLANVLLSEMPSGNGIIYSSTYKAARDTSTILRSKLAEYPFILEDRIIDQSFGIFGHYNDITIGGEKEPKFYEEWLKVLKTVGEYQARIPYGESQFDVSVRTASFISDALFNNLHENIIIISHEVPIKTIMAKLANTGPESVLCELYHLDFWEYFKLTYSIENGLLDSNKLSIGWSSKANYADVALTM